MKALLGDHPATRHFKAHSTLHFAEVKVPNTAFNPTDVGRIEIRFLTGPFLCEPAGFALFPDIQAKRAQRARQMCVHPRYSPEDGRSVYGR